MIDITLKVESSTEKHYRLIELLSKNGYEFSVKPVLLQADITCPTCPNCKETVEVCACIRNRCMRCGDSVGNTTFTVCDKCWDIEHGR